LWRLFLNSWGRAFGLLLGFRVSLAAGMPRVTEITNEVVADAKPLDLGAAMGAPLRMDSLGRVVGLVDELQKCCDDY
jgi:hypothetical protein